MFQLMFIVHTVTVMNNEQKVRLLTSSVLEQRLCWTSAPRPV